MSGDFAYRPKGIDIRIRPPAAEPSARDKAKAAAKAKAEPAPDKLCDREGCQRPAPCRAPRSRENLNEYYWFCSAHAAEYNRTWNFFQGMDDQQYASFAEQARTGHRPTWSMQADARSREAAAARTSTLDPAKVEDQYGILPGRRRAKAPRAVQPERRLNRVQLTALEEMALDETADAKTIRLRYAELIKRFHPDSNGGDRSAEAKLHRVIKAYQVLKAAGMI